MRTTMKSDRVWPRLKRTKTGASGGVFAAIVLFLLLEIIPEFMLREHIVTIRSVGTLTEITHLDFPPSGRIVDAEYHKGVMSSGLIAKVNIPRPDLKQFLSQAQFRNIKLTNNDRLLHDNNGFVWMKNKRWNLKETTNFIEVDDLTLDDRKSEVSIMVDLDNPEMATVYIHFSQ